MIRQTRFHRRGDAQRRMDAAEVVPSHIERNGMFQVLQSPAVSIRQTSESPKLHPECQIAALDMRSRYVARIGPSVLDAWDGSRYPARGTIPFRPGRIRTGIQFDELRVIDIPAKVLIHGRDVPAQPVRCKLEPSLNSLAQVLDERLRVRAFTSADVEREHHLGNAVERKPDVLISPLRRCARAKPSLMAAAERPNLIGLNKLSAEPAHLAIPESTAVLSGSFKQRENCSFMQPRESGNGANAHPFKHQRKSLCRCFGIGVVRPKFGGRFAERDFAGIAAPTLDAALAEMPKPLAGLVLASDAGHGSLIRR